MSARLGRFIAAESHRFGGPLGLTAVAMAVGSAATLVLAVVSEGVAIFSPRVRLLIVWIAAVNTALAYTLWAQSQRTLRAVESSVLGDLTTIQVAAIGWLVLGEGLTLAQLVGLLLALFGVALVQISPALYRRYAPDIAA
jgi:drug/metabolite transporter (DMT)-like permease